MSKEKNVLGRGLDALLQPRKSILDQQDNVENKTESANELNISSIQIDKIDPNPFQPRVNFDEQALDELKKSIMTNGLIQPITIRKAKDGRYQVVSGERRLRAFKEIGYSKIPAYIIEVTSDAVMLAMALIENIQRERLNPIEVANAYKRLMEECSLNYDEIAERVGKDRSTISNSIRLLKLNDRIQQALINDEISMGHARAMINVPSEEIQLQILDKILRENLSVRKVEKIVKNLATLQKKNNSYNKSSHITQHSNNISALEDKLRKIFGTKVICKNKNDGSGEIIIEYYSLDELDRLIEMIDVISKNYN